MPFEENMVDDRKIDFSSHDTIAMICSENANIIGRLLVGIMNF